MPFQRAKIKALEPGLFLIDDAGESTCYLLCGEQKALVIDSVNGRENLFELCRTLTDLPLMVINTHGHGDHIYGNVYFPEAWMHPEDFSIAREHFGFAEPEMAPWGLKPCPLHPLPIGEEIDIGGEIIEIVSLRGHTPGSIGLLSRKRRLLFSGDGLNSHLWMQLDHSLPISALRSTILTLKSQYGHCFDRLLMGHAQDYTDGALIDQLLQGCDDLLAGKREKDTPYHYFGGDCLQHPISDIPGQCIVYTEDKLNG